MTRGVEASRAVLMAFSSLLTVSIVTVRVSVGKWIEKAQESSKRCHRVRYSSLLGVN